MNKIDDPEIEPSQLGERRRRLKQKLWRTRSLRSSGQPLCPICGKEIENWQGGQMHEVFLTRGDAQKMGEFARFEIYAPENCVILCSETCHIMAATKEGKILCACQILLFEGYHQVKNWLRLTGMNWKGTQPEIEGRFIFETMRMLSLSPIYCSDKDRPTAIYLAQPRWNTDDFK